VKIRTILDRILHFGGFGCSDTEQLLFDYAQGELPEETRLKLERHLGDCPSCLRYVETYRRTIEATRRCCAPDIEMPLALQQKLLEFIQQNPSLR
jgi:anti-sigma factor RsiW